ncbi:MAG: hypothetical protein HC906_02350 [Bacteroidales bacterium]|nr:hypothetical protein [Bacteroidales bacterium]
MENYANTAGWFAIMDEAVKNSSAIDTTFSTTIHFNAPNNFPYIPSREEALATQTDWLDNVLNERGKYDDINIASSMGSDKSTHYLSFNYRNDEGIMKNSDLKRVSTRINSDFHPFENLHLGSKLNFSYTNSNRARNEGTGGGYAGAVESSLPWYPVFCRMDLMQILFQALTWLLMPTPMNIIIMLNLSGLSATHLPN